MPPVHVFSLDAVRTDGWFERIGEGIGSFQALCDIVGERFFAFSMITGARITAVTVDRRNPDNTIVDFTVGAAGGRGGHRRAAAHARRLPAPPGGCAPHRRAPRAAARARHRSRSAAAPHRRSLPPARPALRLQPREAGGRASPSSIISLTHDGVEETHDLAEYRARIRAHVRDELERVASGNRGAIDLTRVAEAEAAALASEHGRVLQLLGAWPAPLAIFLRTPEGQMLAPEPARSSPRASVCSEARASSWATSRRARRSSASPSSTPRTAWPARISSSGWARRCSRIRRAGEAIGALRRAATLGADPKAVWPLLARAFFQRGRFIAAFACLRDALDAGVKEADIADDLRQVEAALGPKLTAWRATVITGGRVG